MGDNKVTCDKCDGKRATTKSIRFLSLSYFLGTRLGRLIFNYHKKINLSLYFNAKQYLYSDDDKEAIGSYNVDFDLDNNNNNTSVKPNTDNSQVDMFYELYSIFIHDGGAGDGHYYAHIKDFESDDLIRFNNSVHQKPKEECIRIFAKQDNLNAKPQAKKIIKAEAPAATTTTEKTGEKDKEKQKENVTTAPAPVPVAAPAPAPKDNKKTEAEISKQKKLDTGAQLAATLATQMKMIELVQL